MRRPFASYIVNEVELTQYEKEQILLYVFVLFIGLPLTIFFLSIFLFWLTKRRIFKKIIKWCLVIFTRGIIEQIFLSAIQYIKNNKNETISTELLKDEKLHRMKGTIFTRTSARRIKKSAALLYPFQAYILILVLMDQLFLITSSTETCETHKQILNDKESIVPLCVIRLKSIPNIPAADFFNPINAFRQVPGTFNLDVLKTCENASISQNDTLWKEYHIQCVRHFLRWNNIINTLTNVLQWQQITVFIVKSILHFTFDWQNSFGHSNWWLARSRLCRLFILLLLSILWTAAFILYTLIVIAFNNNLHASQVFISYQTSAILLIPMFIIPLLFYNALTIFHWAIRTLRRKKCEQEVSATFDKHRKILIYAENDQNFSV